MCNCEYMTTSKRSLIDRVDSGGLNMTSCCSRTYAAQMTVVIPCVLAVARLAFLTSGDRSTPFRSMDALKARLSGSRLPSSSE